MVYVFAKKPMVQVLAKKIVGCRGIDSLRHSDKKKTQVIQISKKEKKSE